MYHVVEITFKSLVNTLWSAAVDSVLTLCYFRDVLKIALEPVKFCSWKHAGLENDGQSCRTGK